MDLSDEVLKRLQAENIDGLVSAVGAEGLEILHKLHRKGLHTVCIPRSIENDIAGTALSFGFNSALSTTIEMLNKAYQAARSARKTAVVEVPGEVAGWIAMQAGIAARADAVLMPETPLPSQESGRAVEGQAVSPPALRPGRGGRRGAGLRRPAGAGGRTAADGRGRIAIVPGPGRAAETVARLLQPRIAADVHPLVIGSWARGGNPTAVDQQLGMAFGAATVQALKGGQNGLMVAFVPPEIRLVPLAEAVGKVRTVPRDSEFLRIAQSLGIYLGAGL